MEKIGEDWRREEKRGEKEAEAEAERESGGVEKEGERCDDSDCGGV